MNKKCPNLFEFSTIDTRGDVDDDRCLQAAKRLSSSSIYMFNLYLFSNVFHHLINLNSWCSQMLLSFYSGKSQNRFIFEMSKIIKKNLVARCIRYKIMRHSVPVIDDNPQ
jgi:hypothetical protein